MAVPMCPDCHTRRHVARWGIMRGVAQYYCLSCVYRSAMEALNLALWADRQRDGKDYWARG